MVLDTLRRLTSGPKPVVLLFILLLASFYLMSGATQNTLVFSELYSLLLAINILALLLLGALILRNLIHLIQQFRQRAPGARLTTRLVVMFVVLAVAPVSVVYYFSVEFLHRGIDSWFDLKVEKALEDALELGRTALDGRLRELLRQSRLQAKELEQVSEGAAALTLNDLRQVSEATEMTLLTLSGRVIASSSADRSRIVPNLPSEAILRQLRQGLDYARLEPGGESGLHVRIAVTLPSLDPGGEQRVLQGLYPVSERLNLLADSVQSTFAHYKELSFLREPLKYSFTLTLSLILLLSLLTAVWAAFFSARRLVAPIRDLAEGTQAVAAGNYRKRLPLPSRDELGFLVRSFNEMTYKIAQSQEAAQYSQQQAEQQRAYLEAVLGRLSSGVLTLDAEGLVRTANAAAGHILGTDLSTAMGRPLVELGDEQSALRPFINTLSPYLEQAHLDWHAEVVLFGSKGRQVLMCHGTLLPGIGEIGSGHVVVFDDVTTLIQAQRDAAWGEVARRLAHEIKNPLTPIQLSAERLRHKYLGTLPPEDAEILDRSTHTIVQQVEGMKTMVKAFTDYARPPKIQLESLNLNQLISEVLDLYRGEEHGLVLQLHLDPALPTIHADVGRLRQVLHNLIKNALEAVEVEGGRPRLAITTRCDEQAGCRFIELRLQDNGPGIPETILSQLFEPYVSHKPKGTGLGLAIVKKIVEEHGGMILAENCSGGGACFVIRLPVHPRHAAPPLNVETSSTDPLAPHPLNGTHP